MVAFYSRNIRRFGSCIRVLEMDLSAVVITKVTDVLDLYRGQIVGGIRNSTAGGEYKVQATAKCIFERELEDGVDRREQYISIPAIHVDKPNLRFLEECVLNLDRKIEMYQNLGSNFNITKIESVTFHFLKY